MNPDENAKKNNRKRRGRNASAFVIGGTIGSVYDLHLALKGSGEKVESDRAAKSMKKTGGTVKTFPFSFP